MSSSYWARQIGAFATTWQAYRPPFLGREAIMPHPYAPAIVLDAEGRRQLEVLTRAHSTPQALVFRCRLILRIAAADQPSNLQVANEFGCARNTVALWHTRFLQ